MSKTAITSIIAAIFALGLLLPGLAEARKPTQTRKIAKPAVHKRVVKKTASSKAVPQKFKKETRLTFDDDKVSASAQTGGGALVTGERKAKTSSLIKVRTNFIPELIKSALDI
jgi:hypothetical protein